MEFHGVALHDVAELVYNKESGGYKLTRMPMRVAEKMNPNVTFGATGCEIRFVPLDEEVTVKIRTVGEGKCAAATVYYGSIQSGWKQEVKKISSELTDLTVPKSDRLDILKKITAENDYPFSPEVVRIVLQSCYQYEIFDVVGRCRPPKPEELPKLKYLAYGSSITHGSLARNITDCYAFRLAENFNADQINLGFAGSAKLEPEVADYIANECEFDFATLEMGVNVLKMDPDEFRSRVEYFISTIAKAHSDKKIFCIDVFYMEDDFLFADGANNRAARHRAIVRECVERLALPNVVHISGLEILNGAKWLSEDMVHPNARGVEELAKNLTDRIKKYIARI